MAKIIRQQFTMFKEARDHDYLYDSTFLVSGIKDHERNARKAAMATAQITVRPIFDSMFSELKNHASTEVVYHPNARLPKHVDRSFVNRLKSAGLCLRTTFGCDRYRFFATPKIAQPLSLPVQEPTLAEPKPPKASTKGLLVDKMVQTHFRDSSAQTKPYQPDFYLAEGCEEMPEVLYLKDFEFGPDYKVDSGMVERVNRMRLRRAWTAADPCEAVLRQLESVEQDYRDMEVEEMLLIEEKARRPWRAFRANTAAPSRTWVRASERIKDKIYAIRKNREREIRKLNTKHCSMLKAAEQRSGHRPKSKLASTLVRTPPDLMLDPRFLPSSEDFPYVAPTTLHRARPRGELCRKMANRNEKVLVSLQDVLQAVPSEKCVGQHRYSRVLAAPRPQTPAVEVPRVDEASLAAQALLAAVKGRAVQTQMYEGISRNAQLIQELLLAISSKNTIKEVEKPADDLPEYLELERNKIVSRVMDFLTKELDRLMEERRLSLHVSAALEEKMMREAAEAGRRQVEERRRREHDAMYHEIVRVTRRAADAHIEEILRRVGRVEAHDVATKKAEAIADAIDKEQQSSLTELEEEDLVAELLLHSVLPIIEHQIVKYRTNLKEAHIHPFLKETIYDDHEEDSEAETQDDGDEDSEHSQEVGQQLNVESERSTDALCGRTLDSNRGISLNEGLYGDFSVNIDGDSHAQMLAGEFESFFFGGDFGVKDEMRSDGNILKEISKNIGDDRDADVKDTVDENKVDDRDADVKDTVDDNKVDDSEAEDTHAKNEDIVEIGKDKDADTDVGNEGEVEDDNDEGRDAASRKDEIGVGEDDNKDTDAGNKDGVGDGKDDDVEAEKKDED